MKKLLLIILWLQSIICHAQSDLIVLDLGGGISGLTYKTDSRANASPGIGATVRVGYRHYFDKYMGFGINAVFKTCATNCTLDFTETIGDAVDSVYKFPIFNNCIIIKIGIYIVFNRNMLYSISPSVYFSYPARIYIWLICIIPFKKF